MGEGEGESEGAAVRRGQYVGAANAVPRELAPRTYALEVFHGPAHVQFDFPHEIYYQTEFHDGLWAPEVFSVTLIKEFVEQRIGDLTWDTMHEDDGFASFLG